MDTALSLEQALHITIEIEVERATDGNVQLIMHCQGSKKLSFGTDQFRELDARMVPLLEELVEVRKLKRINPYQLLLALQYWTSPSLLIDAGSVKGSWNSPGESYAVYEVKRLRFYKEHLYLHGYRYDMSETKSGLVYADATRYMEVVIDKAWLDNTYPHWDLRLHFALSLDLPVESISQYLFNSGADTAQNINIVLPN